MAIVKIMRDLWGRRRLVACAAIVAALAGYAVAFKVPTLKSKKYQVGTATTRVLVDTPSSQIVAVAPTGLDLLTSRANLLASLMVGGTIKNAIAQRADLRTDQLVGIAESAPSPVPTPAPPPRGYVLTTTVLNDTDVSNPGGYELPIIEIDTQAPDASGAAALANAAVAGLQDFLTSQAASEGLPATRRIRVTSLGRAQAIEVVHGPRNLMVFGVAIFVFAAGCAAILLIPRLRDEWRATPVRKPIPTHALLDDDLGAVPALRHERAELAPFPAALRAVRANRGE